MTGLLKSQSVPGLLNIGANFQGYGNHHKTTTLKYKLGGHGPMDGKKISMVVSDKAQEIAQLLREPAWRWKDQPIREKAVEERDNMKWPRVAPAWLKHDKQVLRFYAFFQETIVERWDENCRYRNVVICYHLEDGTLSVTEPKVENSGMPMGSFLKRQQVPRNDGDGYIGPGDLRVGEQIEFNGVTFQITGCDRFTRWFYEENGISMAEDESLPKDQWSKSYTFQKLAERGGLPISRSSMEQKKIAMYQLGAPSADLKLVQFLQNDRKVLRFKAYWDDHTLYGNRIYFTIHYYLADNSVEINEAHTRNAGRDNYPVFFKRAPLYKENKVNAYPGMLEPVKIAYEPQDFVVGQTIDVWGRCFVIYDCDDFTQEFYLEHLQLDQKSMVIDVSDRPKVHKKLMPPPHNGIGTEEDALESCLRVQCKPAKQDLARMMTLSGELLRFEARLVNGEAEDENRRFIIGFYPADDHVACWEIPVRNSGHMGGKFQEKKRTKNPNTGKNFQLSELAIGSVVVLAAQPLLIMRADEHTLQYLERNTDKFPLADANYCADNLRSLAELPEMHDDNGIDPDRLKALAAENGLFLPDHAVVTLLRSFNVAPQGQPPMISGPAILDVITKIDSGYRNGR